MNDPIPLPPYAYVPGKTARHDPEIFSTVQASVEAVSDFKRLGDSYAWRAGVAWLDTGYFWEAHEALEPVWMRCPGGSAERLYLEAVIALANAGLKARMGRPNAVSRLTSKVNELSELCRDKGLESLWGFDLETLETRARNLENSNR